MIEANCGSGDPHTMADKTLDLRGLKCPLPALRTRKALAGLRPGDLLIVECTDPLAGIDIPNLVRETGDRLEETHKEAKVTTFRISKR
jgi:tRNA 2-thiouridine synthesizing protein A